MGSKDCFVPSCTNNSRDNPDLLFVPILERLRKEWCRQVNAEYFTIYLQYCCENHLNREDIKNYYKCKLLNEKPKMAPTAQLRGLSLVEEGNKGLSLRELLLQDHTPGVTKKRKLDENILPSTSASTIPFKVSKVTSANAKSQIIQIFADFFLTHPYFEPWNHSP
ncbi:hypothetical protein JYU34_019913 [Plutella xylostella]|uniref:THAP-type domain-containing protein n=1 Tax=Plutella xylostella TaxID=51655 RepID=A0ABQ7PVP7_PLUXY|nr:hypothetical protein JYU34_019913 [Plutella xylostella]